MKPPKPTNGDSVQDSVKIKRLQSQVEKEKRESQKWEDQFYEASAAAERLMVTIADLEHRLMQSKKTHQDDVARIKDRYEGDEDVERQAQVRQEKLEQKLMIVTNRHSEVTLALQRDLLRLQKELKEARGESTSRKPAWMQRAEMESVTKANQLERQLRQQKEEYEARIERLEREVALRSNNAQLAAKERELESIRLKYQQELDKRQYDYDKLKALYDLDKQAWHSYQQPSASGSGFAASEDTEQLQRQIATLTQQKKNTELHYQATMETYEAHIKRMQREAIEKHQKDRETISLLESARAGMEFDRARFQGQVVSLRREKDALQNTVDKFGRIRIDYDRLSDHLPRLQKDYDALKEDYETVKGENAALNEERLLIHATVKAAESKVNEYAALLQVGVAPFDDSYGALSEKYKLLKSTYSLERDQYKQKIKSLKEKLAAAQGDGTVPVYRNAARTAQVAAMSTSEDEDAFLPEADRRKRAKRQHDRDLQYDLFDDPVPLAPTRPLPSTILPRSPSPAEMSPAKTLAHKALQEQSQTLSKQHRRRLHAYEAAKPSYQFPPTIRERKADTKVPRHKNRVYVRSEVRL